MYFIQFIELKKYYAVFLITVVFSTFFYRDSLSNIVEYLSPIRYENFEYLSDKHKINPLVILVSFLIPLASLLVLKNVEGIGMIYLDDKDVIRHKLVKKVIDAYKSIENRD